MLLCIHCPKNMYCNLSLCKQTVPATVADAYAYADATVYVGICLGQSPDVCMYQPMLVIAQGLADANPSPGPSPC